MRILVVGQNPKRVGELPFHGTKSMKTIIAWLKLGLPFSDTPYDVSWVNASLKPGKVTDRDVDPLLSVSVGRVNADKIVAFGAYASRALGTVNVDHFKAPHPSGMNRKLNDPLYVAEFLIRLRQYLHT